MNSLFVIFNTPYIGHRSIYTNSRIHADGDKKGNLYITKLSLKRFARKRTYALGKLVGKALFEKNLDVMDIKLSSDDKKNVLAKVIEVGNSSYTESA